MATTTMPAIMDKVEIVDDDSGPAIKKMSL